MTSTYTEPVSKLLELGRPHGGAWLDYSALDLERDHIPELIRLVEDRELRFMEPPADLPDNEDLPEWYAQIHAWRALGQLKAEKAIPAILGILHQIDDENNDWLDSDADDVFALIGPAAIGPVAEYLQDDTHGLYARVEAGKSLHAIGKAHPETRGKCVKILASVLENYEENDEGLNGFIISDLVRLRAIEHIELIEKAFKSGTVNEMIMGDFEDVQVELGLLEKRITKPARFPFFEMLSGQDDIFEPEKKNKSDKKNEKNKRKQEKKSRKKNRKRK